MEETQKALNLYDEEIDKIIKHVEQEVKAVDVLVGGPPPSPPEPEPEKPKPKLEEEPPTPEIEKPKTEEPPLTKKEIEVAVEQEIAELNTVVAQAIDALKAGNFEQASKYLKEGATRTTCGVCLDKFIRHGLDTAYTGAVCNLGRGGEDCQDQTTRS